MTWLAALDPLTCWRVTLTLLHAGWIGVVLAGLAAAGNRLCRAASAERRYLLNFMGLIVLGLSLPGAFAVVRQRTPRPPALDLAAPPALVGKASEPVRFALPAQPVAVPGQGVARLAAKASEPMLPWQWVRGLSSWITVFYVLGVAAMLGKLVLAVCGGLRLQASCRRISDGPLADLLARQSRRLALRVVPALGYCKRVAVPVVLGLARPMILLPAALVTGLTPDQLSAVLTHELAHIRRHDPWLILVQRALEAVLFFHPAAWYLSRRVDREREHCCDDLVVAAGGDRLVYAGSLLRVAELLAAGRARPLAAPALDGREPSRLRRRVARLLGFDDEPAVRLTRSGVLAFALFAALTSGLGVALLAGQPAPKGVVYPQAVAAAPVVTAPQEPDRAISCRALDEKTGKPVAAATVTFRVFQTKDQDGEEVNRTLDERKTKTDADGRFTVLVPEEYLPDRAPKQTMEVQVEIRHPQYVAYSDSVDPRFIDRFGVSDAFPKFRAVRLIPARTVFGRLLATDGKPLAKVWVIKTYDSQNFDQTRWARDADTPLTDEEGRFRTNVPTGAVLKLGFRIGRSPLRHYEVASGRTDLGEIRIARSVRVAGRVLDGGGTPVPWIQVTVPSMPRPLVQSNWAFTTDENGRFETDGLPPGEYMVQVGLIFRTEDGTQTNLPVKDAPGLYLPLPLVVREGQAVPELTLRPVEHVRFAATFVQTRPTAAGGADLGVPAIGVQGTYQGTAWTSQLSLFGFSKNMGTYTLKVPKGLTDATLDLVDPIQRFRLDAASPELFGPKLRLGRVDADRLDIQIHRYRETTLKVTFKDGGGRPRDDTRVEARYVREPAMRAAGVVFDASLLEPSVSDGEFRFVVLPGEEIEVSATARGAETVAARVTLAEGETRDLALALTKGQ